MLSFLARRLSLLVAGWVLASVIIFLVLRLLPGDVAQVIGGTRASTATVARIRAELGLEAPLWQQYTDWISGVLRGDLGSSLITKTVVSEQLIEKSEVTVPLTVLAMIFTVLIAFPIGVFTAFHNGKKIPDALSTVMFAGAAAPALWVALLCIAFFAHTLHLFPAQGFPAAGWADPLAAFYSLLLPAFTIAVIEAAVLFRFVRSATLRALHSPPVTTGMSFGYTRRQALWRYGLPAASLSLISTLGVQLASLLAGAVVIEQLFNLPGLGSMLISDVGNRDLPKVASVLLVLTGVVLLVGFLVDVLARLADPRLRSQERP